MRLYNTGVEGGRISVSSNKEATEVVPEVVMEVVIERGFEASVIVDCMSGAGVGVSGERGISRRWVEGGGVSGRVGMGRVDCF